MWLPVLVGSTPHVLWELANWGDGDRRLLKRLDTRERNDAGEIGDDGRTMAMRNEVKRSE
jgi:hypothetical protein